MHDHAEQRTGRAFALSATLNVAFVLVELIAGLLSGSIALIADATHNMSDVLGLGLAWGASRLAQRKPSSRRTYGFRRSTILAALFNAVLILVAVGAVAWESLHRLRQPEPVHANVVFGVALAGAMVNGGSALLFRNSEKRDVNVRAAFVHLAGDAAVSLAVALAALVARFTSWWWLDPIASLGVCGAILVSTRALLKESLDLALDAVPEHIEPEHVRRYLSELPGVIAVHDLHIWAMSTTEVALTAHLVVPVPGDARLRAISEELHARFGIEHATIQIEKTEPCPSGECG